MTTHSTQGVHATRQPSQNEKQLIDDILLLYQLKPSEQAYAHYAPSPVFHDPVSISQLSQKFPVAVIDEGHEEGIVSIGMVMLYAEDLRAPLLPLREYTITQLIEAITDKPDWQRKVLDDSIVSKWRAEASTPNKPAYRAPPRNDNISDSDDSGSQRSAERSTDWAALDVSPKMIDWAIDEVKYKAKLFSQINYVEAVDGVWKSDSIIDEELRRALMKAVQPLENLSEAERDWHPGSSGKVLDLVHPSIYPLVYGQSQILVGHTCSADDYHSDLYSVIAQAVGKAIPLWDRVLSRLNGPQMAPRVSDWSNSDDGFQKNDSGPKQEEGEDDDAFDERYTPAERAQGYSPDSPWNVQGLDLQELQDEAEKLSLDLKPSVNLRRDYRRLQIIFKLANIYLTAEKPKYAGGSWHVEGQANESICASAIYYYSNENITASYLSFRQQVEEGIGLPYPQNEHKAIQQIFGIENDSPTIQNVGRVLTREGRLLCFPNVMQHRVSLFRPADPTKPGHRKILALFLVDPNLKIISTENIPPQQNSWWREMVQTAGVFEELSPALAENVLNSDGFPVTLEKAKQQRLELMDERKSFVKWHDDQFVSRSSFSVSCVPPNNMKTDNI
ncbi:MAG: hypothetical protein L6R37_008043 [Teloschistes peruensis]|nr:MAG: hypothetical protein L6R37_008043 [Teloschistes peruensis]